MKSITTLYKTEMGKVLRQEMYLSISLVNSSSTTIATFGRNKIINAEMTDSADPLVRVLPTKKITWSILDLEGEYNPANASGTWTQLNGDEKVIVGITQKYTSGYLYTLASETYYLDGQATWADGVATFSAQGVIAQMQKKRYNPDRAWWTDAESYTSTSNFIKDVLGDYGLTTSDYSVETNTVASHSRLCPESGTTSYAEALQLVANMSVQTLWESQSKIYAATRYNRTASDKVRTLTPRDVLSYDVEQADELGEVDINVYAQTTDETADYGNVFAVKVDNTGYVIMEVNFDGSLCTVYGSANPSIVSGYDLDGFTITDSELPGGSTGSTPDYIFAGSGIDLTVTTFKITPYGFQAYVNVTAWRAASLALIVLKSRKLKRSATLLVTSAVSGASDTAKTLAIDNPLVTTQALATEMQTKIESYLGNRQLLKVKTRGNPELELMDVVEVVTTEAIYTGLLVEKTETYNGVLESNLVLRLVETPTQIKFINRNTDAWYLGMTNTFWTSSLSKQNGGSTPAVGDYIYNVCEDNNGTNDNTLWKVTAISTYYTTVEQVTIS